jgi:hypothetical protein
MFEKGVNRGKKGQVTIFIIIAIVIVAIVFGYLLLRGSFSTTSIPASIQPAYNSFVTCLEEDIETGINILGSQGGYIELPDFEPGSAYMPFSSQLNFAGNPIPYWYYVSRNGIQREQIPSKSEMEQELATFIEGKVRDCNLRGYYDEGFVISMNEPEASVRIDKNKVGVELEMDITFEKEEDAALVRNHKVSVNSRLGQLYDSAKVVYEEEQDELFLEKYGVDVLRLYAPVDGVEITCSPLVWDAEEVFSGLQEAIDANMAALKSKGPNGDYFALNLPIEEDMRFLTSRNWPNSFEVLPGEEQILIATPVGNQAGMGILGFCYVPYHFVYNIKYPVLVQVYEGEEIFQFPMAVVIQGNNPRESLDAEAAGDVVPELCRYKNTEMQVNTYDSNFDSIDALISYECFGNSCTIGETTQGSLEENFPQCVNGYVVAKASGFKDTRYLFSTVQSGSLDIIMERVYETNVELVLDGVIYNGDAMITISSDYTTKTLVYPEQRTVELGEGQHEIQVQIFRDSAITLGATTKEQCVEVPRGILGVFGLTKDKCFEIEVPEQIISNALAGGGQGVVYVLETELARGRNLQISVEGLPIPTTIDDIQSNYLLFEQKDIDVRFV